MNNLSDEADSRKKRGHARKKARGAPYEDSPSPPPTLVQLVNAALIGSVPALCLLSMFGALDYLASRVFYSSGYIDPDATMYKESVIDDSRFTEFSPYDDYSIEVFASSDLASIWSHLDPLVQARIWLRSLYPIRRPEADMESNGTTSALRIANMTTRYGTTTNPVELYSRAVSAGRPNDVVMFLDSFNACASSGTCKEGMLKEQISTMVLTSYLIPAKDLLMEGQCARAGFVAGKASNILEALDLSRGDDNAVVDLTRQLLVIAEHPSCASGYRFIGKSLKDVECCYASRIDTSRWPNEFSELRDYGIGLRRFDQGDFVGALSQFRSVSASATPSLSELATFMSIRSIFWSVIYRNREDLWSRKLDTLENRDGHILIPVNFEPADAIKEIEKLSLGIKSRSLLTDTEEYKTELLVYMGLES